MSRESRPRPWRSPCRSYGHCPSTTKTRTGRRSGTRHEGVEIAQLAGSRSHDYTTSGSFVPAAQTFHFRDLRDQPRAGALYSWPRMFFANLPGYPGTAPSSSKKPPCGPSSGRVASRSAIAAPCSGVHDALNPMKSVATYPRQPALTMTFVSASRRAYGAVMLVSIVFDGAQAPSVGPLCRVSDPISLDMLTIRGELARRNNGSVAFVTRTTPGRCVPFARCGPIQSKTKRLIP